MNNITKIIDNNNGSFTIYYTNQPSNRVDNTFSINANSLTDFLYTSLSYHSHMHNNDSNCVFDNRRHIFTFNIAKFFIPLHNNLSIYPDTNILYNRMYLNNINNINDMCDLSRTIVNNFRHNIYNDALSLLPNLFLPIYSRPSTSVYCYINLINVCYIEQIEGGFRLHYYDNNTLTSISLINFNNSPTPDSNYIYSYNCIERLFNNVKHLYFRYNYYTNNTIDDIRNNINIVNYDSNLIDDINPNPNITVEY